LVDEITENAKSWIERFEIRDRLEPLFAEALEDSSITAWIAANDLVAEMALDFLQERTTAVPAKVSLISFDNSLTAAARRLTSYDFNIEGSIRMALDYLIAPSRTRRRIIEVDGWMAERDTAGPAARSSRRFSHFVGCEGSS
jgi:DNA-binding LacI/PurR family transcriptional regulator